MKKPILILFSYLIGLVAFSLFFSAIGLGNLTVPVLNKKILLTPMLFITIAGGIIALFLSLPRKIFNVFISVYLVLWLLRILLLFIGNSVGQVHIGSRIINVDFVIANYYKYMSRLDGPLPFVLFGFINYLFSVLQSYKDSPQENT